MFDVKNRNAIHKEIVINISFSFPSCDFKREMYCITVISAILPLIMVTQSPSGLFTFPDYLLVGRC